MAGGVRWAAGGRDGEGKACEWEGRRFVGRWAAEVGREARAGGTEGRRMGRQPGGQAGGRTGPEQTGERAGGRAGKPRSLPAE